MFLGQDVGFTRSGLEVDKCNIREGDASLLLNIVIDTEFTYWQQPLSVSLSVTGKETIVISTM
jgi:hypothetical protein